MEIKQTKIVQFCRICHIKTKWNYRAENYQTNLETYLNLVVSELTI